MNTEIAIAVLKANRPDHRAFPSLGEAVDLAVITLEALQNKSHPKTSQEVLDIITRLVDDQDAKDVAKYGHSLDNELGETKYDWQLMALEEMADGMKYLLMETKKLREENLYLENEIENHRVVNTRLRADVEGFRKANKQLVEMKHLSTAPDLTEVSNTSQLQTRS